MVKEKNLNGKKCYYCEECNFAYLDKKLASKCEDYCKEHQACSMEITKHSIKQNEKT